MNDAYDLVIVGGGSIGVTAARFAAQLGARVALAERDRIGGECTWTGCLPSKTLLKAAKVAHQMRTADHYGLPSVEPVVNVRSVMAHRRPSSPTCTTKNRRRRSAPPTFACSWAPPASSILIPWPLARPR